MVFFGIGFLSSISGIWIVRLRFWVFGFLDLGVWILTFGFWIWGFQIGFGILGFVFWILCCGVAKGRYPTSLLEADVESM